MTRLHANAQSRFKLRAGPGGAHFFNRGTGLNVLFDEVQMPQAVWHKAPRQVSIALTNACDLTCAYCYAPKYSASLDYQRLTTWCSELDQNGCLGVGFGGGEPTLYKLLPELCHHAVENTQLAVCLTTHAHRLSDELIRRLKGNLHFVRISMDGIAETYERLRGRSYAALVHKIGAVAKAFPFGINYVVNHQTLPEIDEAISVVENLGAQEFLLLPEINLMNGACIAPQIVEGLQAWVAGYRGTLRLAVSWSGAEGLPTCDPLVLETGLQAYAHLDASAVLKESSFDSTGVAVDDRGIMHALEKLRSTQRGIAL